MINQCIEGKEHLKQLSDAALIQMVNEIYDWHFNLHGDLTDGLVRKFAKTYFERSAYDAQDFILKEAHGRYGKVVKMLFINNPSIYLER